MSSSEDVALNRAFWSGANAAYTDGSAESSWSSTEIVWGVFGVPEADLRVLPELAGRDACELGCGTAYFSAWLARRGAHPVAVDVTPAQLDTARRMQKRFAIEFPLIEASAEDVPLPDASFDLVLSEHGASTWCQPDAWISEAARLLRPGGSLIFMHLAPLATICLPEEEGEIGTHLQRPYFGLDRTASSDAVEFRLTHGEWIDTLRRHGLAVERLIEVRAPEGARRHPYYDHFPAGWGRKWPVEEIWVALRR
jgi:SAM-dependent methyltransferase